LSAADGTVVEQVTVLESRDRVGGRVCDESVNESIVGQGAQLINGCVNNPFALICHQVVCHIRTNLKSFSTPDSVCMQKCSD